MICFHGQTLIADQLTVKMPRFATVLALALLAGHADAALYNTCSASLMDHMASAGTWLQATICASDDAPAFDCVTNGGEGTGMDKELLVLCLRLKEPIVSVQEREDEPVFLLELQEPCADLLMRSAMWVARSVHP